MSLNLRDLWAHRELLYFLTWRDIKVRYKQTLLGAAWAIIQPLLTVLIFTVIFGRIVNIPSDGVPYLMFTYAGLLPWSLFSNSLTRSSNSLVSNAHLISKVFFPRLIIPGAAVAGGLIDFAIASSLLWALMVYHRVPLSWHLLALPALTILTTLLALGCGMLISALNVKYRDLGHMLPFLIQLLMFATPIIYPTSVVPAEWRRVMSLNPLAGIIEGYRAALFGRGFNWSALSISVGVTLIALVCGAYTFRRMEKDFADVI